jgi:hypothetical protein
MLLGLIATGLVTVSAVYFAEISLSSHMNSQSRLHDPSLENRQIFHFVAYFCTWKSLVTIQHTECQESI